MALMTAVMAPVMIMMLAMGIEVTFWSVNKVELQRIADIAAWAGAREYTASNSAQTATGVAANLAEINGITGTATRTWNATAEKMTDNLITAQVVAGVKAASDTAVQVTVQRSIATSFSAIFPGTPAAITVSATATAEIVAATPLGPQPCLVALAGDAIGITTGTDITLSGSATVTASGCSVRSNAGISISGSSTIDVDGTYAGGTISTSGSASITGGSYQKSGQIQNPYASDTALNDALASLSSGGTTVNLSGTTSQTISPGTYSSINLSASSKLTMNPGLYLVNGNVSLSGSAAITGTGVTILSSGSLSVSGSGSMGVTAPLSTASSGIPGIMFASESTAASTFSGSASTPFAGVIYYPNGAMTFSGSAAPGGGGCTEVIASDITLSGSSNLAANCSSYGTLGFGSLPSSSTVALVE